MAKRLLKSRLINKDSIKEELVLIRGSYTFRFTGDNFYFDV